MRYLLLPACALFLAGPALAEIPKDNGYEVAKVNHEWIDKDSFTTGVIGDLKEKAKYQVSLEKDPKDPTVKGIRFAIHWKAPHSGAPRFTVKLYAHGYDAGNDKDSIIE